MELSNDIYPQGMEYGRVVAPVGEYRDAIEHVASGGGLPSCGETEIFRIVLHLCSTLFTTIYLLHIYFISTIYLTDQSVRYRHSDLQKL